MTAFATIAGDEKTPAAFALRLLWVSPEQVNWRVQFNVVHDGTQPLGSMGR
jgi:hypothetical protein